MPFISAPCRRISIISSNAFRTVAPKELLSPGENEPDSIFRLRVIAVESYAFDTCPKVVSALDSSLKGLDNVTDSVATWSWGEGDGVMRGDTLGSRPRYNLYSTVNRI